MNFHDKVCFFDIVFCINYIYDFSVLVWDPKNSYKKREIKFMRLTPN